MTAALDMQADAPAQTQRRNDYAYSRADFDVIASMMFKDTGVFLAESKMMLVYSRLTKRLRTLKIATFKDYCALVSSPEGADERKNMMTALTTNVTRFFREPHHFEHMAQTVLPPLIERARAGGRVRLWSAACSNGQEPYSMALTVLETFPDAERFDIKILATDIDTNMLAEAREGVYAAGSLSLVKPETKKTFFEETDDGEWRVKDAPRRLVSFRELNLNGSWPMSGPFDLIVCRNVVIYFQEETQERLWGRFADLMAPGAHLYVGHSERVGGPASDRLSGAGATIYVRG
ncbi:MAG: protein-glutamate O-methyltransferase CheR [Pseudomonadota bacterium]